MTEDQELSMPSTRIADAEEPAAAGAITDAAISLHGNLFAGRSLDRAEAEALFDLDRTGLSRATAWTTFFIEAVTDHVIWGLRPTGRLSPDQANWLLDCADRTLTPASFAILVNVLDEAQEVPSWFPGAVKARALAGWPGVSRGPDIDAKPLLRAA